MKFLIIIFLALAGQSIADTLIDSSYENYKHPNNNNAEKVLDDMLIADSKESNSYWQSEASSLPEAAVYKTKVTKRIENSYILSSIQHLKEKLYELADQKLEKCVTLGGQGLERSCIGRSMGQMMQLISATEKYCSNNAYIWNMRNN